MENPGTRGAAERAVGHVLEEHREEMESKVFTAGLSLVRRITDALRREGLLRDEVDG